MFIRKTLLSVLIGSALMATSANAETFSTDFEFTDQSLNFTLNTSPNSVTFTNGEAKFISVPNLYRSGSRAFLFQEGTATIDFETPPESVTFFVRNQTAAIDSVVNIFEVGRNLPVASVTISSSPFQEVTFTSTVGIDRIEAVNNTPSTSIYAAIDDFSFTPFANSPTPVIGATPVGNVPTELTDPIPESIALSDITLDLELVTGALSDPLVATTAPGVDGFTFIAEQSGIIWSLNEETDELTNLISLAESIITIAFFGDERGLLGLAFHPDFTSNGLVYTYSSEPITDQVDFTTLTADEATDHHSVIAEWQATLDETTGITFDADSRRELFSVAQPQTNHNGGSLVFDNSNNLIIAFGDGGNADDQGTGHSAGGNGQDSSNILGTLVRIDPLTRNSTNGNYGIPGDNPFVNNDSIPNEIYATGLRNPFRTFYDLNTDLLYVGDVGQNDIEEINLVESGGNYGWPQREGSFGFFNNGNDSGFVFDQVPNADFTDPIAQYDHDTGIAVIGGLVYNGNAVDELNGQYIFGEVTGPVYYLDENNTINQIQIDNSDFTGQAIFSFGQDTSEQLYILTKDFVNDTGSIFRVRNQAPVTPEPVIVPVVLDEVEESSSSSGGGSLGGMLILMLTGLVARIRKIKQH